MRKLTLDEKITLKGILASWGWLTIPSTLTMKQALFYWGMTFSPRTYIKDFHLGHYRRQPLT